MSALSVRVVRAGMAALACAALPALAQSLGAASSFAVAGYGGVTAAGPAGTVVSGDVGAAPTGSITGFPPALVVPPFGLHANDAAAIAAQAADVALYTTLGSGACTDNLGAQMNGANIGPGIHCFSSTADLAALGTMTLSGAGIYIFRVPTGLTANVGSSVTLAGVDPCSVFWQVGSAATLNGVNFPGNVVAQAGVTLGVGASLTGRALATAGPVTLSGGNTVGGCSSAIIVPPGVQPPTLTKAFSPASILVNGTSTLTITLLNPNTTSATLTAALVDTLPSGVVIAAVPNAGTTCGGSGAIVAAAGGSSVTLPAARSIPGGSGSTPGSCTVTVDVTGNAAGTFLDVIAANALQTTNGNNTLGAQATLTITPAIPAAPTVAKAFSPASIAAAGVSQLVITLTNPNLTVATLTAALADTLPGGVVVAATPNASTTCGGGAVTATAGASTVTLPATRTIPAGVGTTPGSCTVTVNVTAPGCGNFINTIAANALQTSNGNNAGAAVATLAATCVIVPPPPGPVSPVPTLSEWAMILIALGLAAMGFVAIRRRNG